MTPKNHQGKGYGWKPGLPDHRDLWHDFSDATAADKIDLTDTGKFPAIWDQGQLGSCVAHGVPRCYVYDAGDPNFTPSRLFVYYNGRVIESTVGDDSGLTIADGIKSLNKYGAPPEGDWPYDIAKFTEKPPLPAYNDGKLREAVKYARVSQTDTAMKACLTGKLPFAIGFTVYASFESDDVAANGVVPMPTRNEQVMGGHCMCVVGYLPGADLADLLRSDNLPVTNVNASATYYKTANSWGEGWGHAGYCYMPSAYLRSSSLASDFWTVQTVSSPDPGPTPTPTDPTIDKAAVQARVKQLADWLAAQ